MSVEETCLENLVSFGVNQFFVIGISECTLWLRELYEASVARFETEFGDFKGLLITEDVVCW